MKHVGAITGFGNSDTEDNSDDSLAAGGDVGGTGDWPSTTANSYRVYARIYAVYAQLNEGKKCF